MAAPARLMTAIRWRLSLFAWWLWLKITPESEFKDDLLQAVVGLRSKYPRRPAVIGLDHHLEPDETTLPETSSK